MVTTPDMVTSVLGLVVLVALPALSTLMLIWKLLGVPTLATTVGLAPRIMEIGAPVTFSR